jgi:hypothetical protein
VTELPDQIAYKLTYQTEGHTSEGPLLSRFLGQFGIIDMVGSRACGPEEPFGNTEYLFFFFFFFGPIYIPEYKPETKPGRSYELLHLETLVN